MSNSSADDEAPIEFYDKNAPFFEFSNFYRTKQPLVHGDKRYATSEHLYQALKYMPQDASEAQLAYAEQIRLASTPNKARILARRKVGGGYAWRLALNDPIRAAIQGGVEMRQDWDDVKIDVMRDVLDIKFRADAHCRDALLSTGERRLVEHTHRDNFWADGPDGSGLNHLGRLLVEQRDKLRARQAPKRRRVATAIET